jgi:hypothetical protein
VLHRIAGVEVPDFVLRNPMQGGKLLRRDQEEDARKRRRAPRDAEVPALVRQRLQPERGDELARGLRSPPVGRLAGEEGRDPVDYRREETRLAALVDPVEEDDEGRECRRDVREKVVHLLQRPPDLDHHDHRDDADPEVDPGLLRHRLQLIEEGRLGGGERRGKQGFHAVGYRPPAGCGKPIVGPANPPLEKCPERSDPGHADPHVDCEPGRTWNYEGCLADRAAHARDQPAEKGEGRRHPHALLRRARDHLRRGRLSGDSYFLSLKAREARRR